ncbi:tissue factor pathway inhibitor [Lasius niger]|uniref:Tissue factor pathway inhibitor n=1 Tax=Lasius niger TaxID=67767 RepID=A0A0J7JZ65_LASNI|nr:tissue factor pathway inhibitor [Lasius niger]
MSREYLRAVAEMIIEKDDERPGFWADLLVEVARLQADRRCVRQAATSGGEENVAAPETPEDACEVGEATGDTEANASHDVKAEAPKDSPPTAKKEAVVVPPRPQEYGRLWDPPPKGVGGTVAPITFSGSAPGEETAAR